MHMACALGGLGADEHRALCRSLMAYEIAYVTAPFFNIHALIDEANALLSQYAAGTIEQTTPEHLGADVDEDCSIDLLRASDTARASATSPLPDVESSPLLLVDIAGIVDDAENASDGAADAAGTRVGAMRRRRRSMRARPRKRARGAPADAPPSARACACP